MLRDCIVEEAGAPKYAANATERKTLRTKAEPPDNRFGQTCQAASGIGQNHSGVLAIRFLRGDDRREKPGKQVVRFAKDIVNQTLPIVMTEFG